LHWGVIDYPNSAGLTLTFEEIVWFDDIVDKLAWKHHVVPAEVEDVLAARTTLHLYN